MEDDCCRKSCQCCAVPKYSIALSLLTVLFFGITIVIILASPTHEEPCKCVSSLHCCIEDLTRCGSGHCSCLNDASQERTCEERHEELEGLPLALAWVFFIGGLTFVVLSGASCCCFGCLKKDETFSADTTFVGIPVADHSPVAAEMEKL